MRPAAAEGSTMKPLPGLLLAVSIVATPVAAEVRIGVGAPITGPDAVFGAEIRNGVEQAAHEINMKGGILGKHVVLSIGDDAGDPKKGVAVANKFMAIKVSFVVGHFNSTVTLPTSEIYADHTVLDITPASTNPQVTERGLDMIFRTCGRDDQQARVAANFLAAQTGKKIAIVHDNTTYGKGLADDTRKDLLALGVKDVLYDDVNKGETDYSAIVSKIKAAAADYVYWGGLAPEAGLILRQMRDQGVDTVLIAGDGIAGGEFVTNGGNAVEGTLMTFPTDPRNRPEAAEVVKKFKAKNINPEAYTLYSYAAVQVIEQAAQAARALDPTAIAKVMHSGMHFKTAIGDISYDAKGDVVTPDYAIFVWKKGVNGTVGFYERGKP
jgi:branched-chain amino acid transport system substrate-binding protein